MSDLTRTAEHDDAVGTLDPEGDDASPPPGDDLAAAIAWRPHVAWAVTALMFLMVTKGPVFRIRFEAAPLAGDFIDDRWVQGAFFLGAIAVIAVCAPAARRLATDPLLIGSVAVLVGLVVLSGAWSVNPARTVEQGVMMAAGTAAALLAGATLGRLGIVTALAAAAHVGVAVSLFAYARDWFLVVDRNGDLAGIYFNRNSLGPVAVAAAATAAVLGVVAIRHRRFVLAGVLVVAAAVDVWVWWMSGSLTPVFGLAVAGAVVAVFVLALPGGAHERIRRRVALVAGIVMGVAALGAVVARGVIATRLGRAPTLSGRTEIWDVVLQYVGRRPLHGHGFMAAWTRPGIVDDLGEQYGREVYEAHSGFLEVLLGVGIVGLAALVVVVVIVLHRVGVTTWRRPDTLGVFLFAIAVYAVAVNFGETYVGANLLPWTLLMVVACRAVAERRCELASEHGPELEPKPEEVT